MAGIFPSAGISAPNTTGGDPGVDTVPGCDALFYRNNCGPRFDPVAMNYMISELANAVNALGDDYNCSKTDNLKTTMLKLRNLCTYPTINSFGTSTINDFLLACVDGVSGKVPLNNIIDLFKLCSLPTLVPDLDDFIAGCWDNAEGKVTVASLVQLIIGQLPEPPINMGAALYRQGARIPTDEGNNNDETGFIDATNMDGMYCANWFKEQFNGSGPRFGTTGSMNTWPASNCTGVISTTVDPPGGGPNYTVYAGAYDGLILKVAPLTWYCFSPQGIRGKRMPVLNDNAVRCTTDSLAGQGVSQFFPLYKL